MSKLSVLLMGVLGCTGSGDTYDPFMIESTDCQLASSVTIDGQSANLVGCRTYYFGSPSEVVSMEFMTPATRGSFALPGAGWLTLAVNGESAQDTTLALESTLSSIPAEVATTGINLTYTPTGGGRIGGRGSVAVTTNVVQVFQHTVDFHADLSGVTLLASANQMMQLGGSLTLHAEVVAATGGDTSTQGGNGPNPGCTATGDFTPCNGLKSQCAAGGIAPCYCAAACICHYGCDTSCEIQNRALAVPLGTTCSY